MSDDSAESIQIGTVSPIDTDSSNRDLDFQQARLAFSIIQSLLTHTQVVSDLVALMAQVLDEDTTKAVTKTPHWGAYLESRRAMERTREDVENFVQMMNALSDEQ
jgi:hypothetical protein